MKSIPAALLIFDELDEMNLANVALGIERASGQQQVDRQLFKISTPTIEKFGINLDFEASSQDHFCFRCPHCNRLTELLYPDCLVITADSAEDVRVLDSHLLCRECKHILDHDTKVYWLADGIWVPQYTNRVSRGFQINQLYSMVESPANIAKHVLKADSNPAYEQELHNSKMGLPHTVEGAKVSNNHIDKCMGTHKKFTSASTHFFTTIGIDVGKWLHYEIDQWTFDRKGADLNSIARVRLLSEGKVANFEELDTLMYDFQINFAVIDANPERRKSFEFAQRFFGIVKICFYGNNISGKQIHLWDEKECGVTVDRTSWMDVSLGRIKAKRISFPVDLSVEYKDHIKAPTRIYKEDVNGNPTGRYVTGNEPDHFAHSRTYNEIALQLGAALGGNQDITEDIA
jgi:hypothetical protein